MVADGLTKPLSGPAFQQFVKQIGLTDISSKLEKRRLNEIQETELMDGMAMLEIQRKVAVSADAASTGGV